MQKSVNVERNTETKCLDLSPLSDTNLEHRTMFDIMFLHNDEDQTVEVVESSTIDFNAIIELLREGNSIFIAPKNQRSPQRTMHHKRPNYINHI